MKVLFVDDESPLLEQAEIFLQRMDERLEVDSVGSAKEGLKMLDENEYDAVVSDYQMPEMDGLEFLEEVRRGRGSSIPFIIFTGKGREEVAMEALNLGADRYLQKGGDPKTQYGVLAQAIVQEVEYWHTREEFRSSQKKYKDLAEMSLVGIYVIQDDRFRYANPEFCNIMGYDREEIIGKKYLDLVAPEDRKIVREGVEERQEGEGEPTRYTFKALTKDGDKIEVEVHSVPSTFQGEPAVQGTLLDITESKKTLSRLKTLMENQEIGILFEDEDREILYVNQKFCDLFGLPGPDSVIGTSCTDALTRAKNLFSDPEDFVAGIENAIKNREPIKGEELELADGRTFLRDYVPVRSDDRYIGHLWQYRDITERKDRRRELRLKTRAMDRAHIGISITDATEPGNPLIYVNDGFEKITGYSEEEVLGRNPKFLQGEDTDPQTVEKVSRAVSEERPISVEILNYRKDGTPFWNSMHITPIANDRGEVTHFFGFQRDVTRRKELENREEFLHSLLRHDVKNKTQVAEKYLDLLSDMELPEEAGEYVEKTARAVDEAGGIIEKVKKLSDISGEIDVGEIELSSVIDDVLDEYESELSERGINAEWTERSCRVFAGSLLKELFSNLVENAIRHSGCDIIRISSEEGEGKCVVTVEDDGSGIADEDKDKVFERGYGRGQYSKSGLGAFMAKKIAEEYGGSIEVKDSELGGAKFEVSLKSSRSNVE